MAYKTIAIVGTPTRKELAAGGVITPGHLLEMASDGDVEVHGTAGGTASKWFALEDDLQGNEISDAYAAANQVQTGFFRSGDEVNAILANGENAAIGSMMESNGDGELRVVDADASAGDIGVQSVVGFSMVALDFSGSSGVDPASQRLRICIL